MPTPLAVKTAPQIKADILRVIKNGLTARGVASPNVGPGSDYDITAASVATEIEPIYAAVQTNTDAQMPDTAVGADLDDWLRRVGLARRSAGPSNARVILVSISPTAVPTLAELTDPNGAKFRVTTGGTYASGQSIPIQSVATGQTTNLAPGTVMRWTTPPTFASSTAALDALGATGGVDAEDDETARSRLLQRLQNPPGGGNASQLAGIAEGAAVEIQKAFVYPACNGPATQHAAVVGYASSSTLRWRGVSPAGLLAAQTAALAGLSEFVETVITSVNNSLADVSFLLTLPDTSTASAGSGTGWLDANPWPNVSIGANVLRARVTAVTNSTSITVESMAAPSGGETIAWVSHSNFKMTAAKVLTSSLAVAGTPNTYAITIDTPFTGVAVNDYISPAAVNHQTYLTALLGAFASLGPGEKTNVPGVLPRAYRRPRNFESFDYTLGGKMLKSLSDSGAEVLDVAWGYQNAGVTVPALPVLITDPPNIFVPRQLAIYRSAP